jgi:hypothetical protein
VKKPGVLFSIASVSKSVAKFVTLNFYVPVLSRASLKAMASEYASSPVEQAAIHAQYIPVR